MSEPSGKSIRKFSSAKLQESPAGKDKGKAVLFVAEGTPVENKDLDIEVVAVDTATFEAMCMRRC
jgi:hypothetical protein